MVTETLHTSGSLPAPFCPMRRGQVKEAAYRFIATVRAAVSLRCF